MFRSLFAVSILMAWTAAGTAQPASPASNSSTIPNEGEKSMASTDDPAAPPQAAPASQLTWFKGNTHTHTLNSDGDSTPGEVAQWYRDNGYDFLVISDHNVYTVIDVLQAEIDEQNRRQKRRPFLLISGEEVTDGYKDGQRGYAIHVNALNTTRVVGKQGGASVVETLQRCADAIRQAGGLPFVCHPNFVWSLNADHLAALENVYHFEVCNAHPAVHNFGGSGRPGTEEIWDDLLSRGRLYYGLATDDAHTFKHMDPAVANPGRGWICVLASDLTADTIVEAIDRGDFYASSGVELERVSREDGTLSLVIRELSAFGAYGYRTQFIGQGGRVLAEDQTLTPSYSLKSGELYVRARVMDSGHRFAWTQPALADHFPGKR